MTAPLMLLALLLQPAPPPTTQPTLDEQRAEARALINAEVQGLPTIAPGRRADLITIRLSDEGLLDIRPLVTPDQDTVVVPITDWPGVATLQVRGDDAIGRQVYLVHRSFDVPGLVCSYTHVIGGPLSVQVSRDSESPTTHRSVQLIQSALQQNDPDERVRLYVQETNLETGAVVVNLTLPAASVDALREQHGDVVRQYLQPILDDLGSGSTTIGASAAAAWQVFARQLPRDPSVSVEMDTLLKQLDADAFLDRERARARMETLGPAAAAELLHRDLATLSPEARSAVEAFLAPYSPLPAEQAQAMRSDVAFVAESVPLLPASLRAVAVARLRELVGQDVPIDPAAGDDTLVEQVRAFRAALPPATTQPGR